MKRKIWILIAMAGLLFTNRAYADLGFSYHITSFPVNNLTVISLDGANYTKNVSAQSTLSAVIDVEIDAGLFGVIHSWSTWLNTDPVGVPGANKVQHKSGGFVRTYNNGPGYVNEVDKEVAVTADYSTLAVNNCNKLADDLRNQGYTNDEIFSEDHTIQIDVTPSLDYDINHNGEVIHEVPNSKTVELVCKAFEVVDDGPTREPSPEKAHLLSAVLNMLYEEEPTDCPTEVTASAVFIADVPGVFTFRFRSIFGQVSDPIDLTVQQSDFNPGTGIYVKTYVQPFMTGEEADPIVIGGGDVVPNNIGDKKNPEDHPDGDDSINIDDAIIDVTGPNLHWDTLWIEIIDAGPGSVETSDFDSYNVICNYEVNSNLAPVDGYKDNSREDDNSRDSGSVSPLMGLMGTVQG